VSKDTKTTKQLRAELKNLIHDEFQKLPETLENMEPKQRLDILIKLLPYAMSKNEKI